MSAPATFQDLIGRVRVGDQDAATELVRRYEPAIRRAVRFRLADSQLSRLFDSMDICQSVMASFFIRAAAGQYDIEQPEQLVKLLGAMARNKLAFQSRAQGRQRRDFRRLQTGPVSDEQFAESDPSPSQQAAGNELLEQAQRLFSPEEKELVELRKDGLEWNAIAERLGGTPEGLRKKLARAVDRVAHQLDLDDYSDE
jgi:RNA polymerase sigma factor (sigma-70 family)